MVDLNKYFIMKKMASHVINSDVPGTCPQVRNAEYLQQFIDNPKYSGVSDKDFFELLLIQMLSDNK